MKEQEQFINQEETRAERLFEFLYGYPKRLADQVIEMECVEGDLLDELKQFHQARVDFVEELLDASDTPGKIIALYELKKRLHGGDDPYGEPKRIGTVKPEKSE